jgi:hypothetical protein
MSACHRYPTKDEAIEGFCDEFEGFCSVSTSGVESVPSDVEKSILFDTDSTNDKNDCDGGFDFDLACPTACGRPQTTVTATYRVVADAFGGGEECPYHDGFVMNVTCPATEPCAVPCEGSWTSPPCPTACGTPASTPSKTWTMTTPAQNGGSCPNTGPAPTYSCPATPGCAVPCVGSWTSPPCPTACGTPASTPSKTWTMTTPAQNGGSCPNTGPAPTYSCPSTPACTVPCGGEWSQWSGCPSCGTTSTSHTRSRTWTTTSTLPSGYAYSPACPTTQYQYCPETSKCVTPEGTKFTLPDNYYDQVALELGRIDNSWFMGPGYREISSKSEYYYSFTSPELINITRFGYEAHSRSDILPSDVEWYSINPDGTWNGPLRVSERTSTKSNNYAFASFVGSKGSPLKYLSKGLVLKIKSWVPNPDDNETWDDDDFYLTFDVSGTYAGEFANW